MATGLFSSERKASADMLPLLPLRNIVVFPYMIVPLFVGRKKSIRALEGAINGDKSLFMVAQKDISTHDPSEKEVFRTGTLGTVLQVLKLPDGTVKVLIEGGARARLNAMQPRPSYDLVRCTPLEEDDADSRVPALVRSVKREFGDFAKMEKKISDDVQSVIGAIEQPGKLADTIIAHINIKLTEKQKLLETLSVAKRLEAVLSYMGGERELLQVEKKIRGRVRAQMEKTQREYYLNEQMKAIQKELGDSEDGRDDFAEFEKKIKETDLSKEAREKADAELKKLKNMNFMSAEATVVRNYLDWLLSVPWNKKSTINKDLDQAERRLDEDHYGLKKVKERVLEYLAVQQRTDSLRGSILCLVGPPGVGKTSLGQSIARVTGREFTRISLGGIRDESEIRGHRRTYIGSMPGKIIQAMKKVKTSNPLILLDEVDKLGLDYRGDPASALLEVLDPEQNHTFNDHYLEVDYDLSDVMFVTTANTLNITPPLRDRMEIIRIAGYTENEKLEIAARHLMPKALKEHGLKRSEFKVGVGAMRTLVRLYTREAGVRNLQRELFSLARKITTRIVRRKGKSVTVNERNLGDYLGVPKFRFGQTEEKNQIGVAIGLAWTEVGGELLTVEAAMLPGKGKMMSTGKLGEVMKESINAASSYVRSRSAGLGIEPPLFERSDIHVHVPEGATPKDGPSAGVAMATAIVSLMTGIPARRDVAMTGEITLRGRVLPIGGLKEKLLAAGRAGCSKVLIPQENARELAEIRKEITKGLKIIPVQNVDDVLAHALIKPPKPIDWKETAYQPAAAAEGSEGAMTTH